MHMAVCSTNISLHSLMAFLNAVIEACDVNFCPNTQFDSIVKRKAVLLCSDFDAQPSLQGCATKYICTQCSAPSPATCCNSLLDTFVSGYLAKYASMQIFSFHKKR